MKIKRIRDERILNSIIKKLVNITKNNITYDNFKVIPANWDAQVS